VGIVPSFIMKKIKKLKEKIKTLLKKILASEWKNAVLYILGYGVLVNYMLWGIFGINFIWYKFPAYGILTYLLHFEFTIFWSKIRGGRRRE